MAPLKALGKLFCWKGIDIKSIQSLELDECLESADSAQIDKFDRAQWSQQDLHEKIVLFQQN